MQHTATMYRKQQNNNNKQIKLNTKLLVLFTLEEEINDNKFKF
jgi:hypothetical protein